MRKRGWSTALVATVAVCKSMGMKPREMDFKCAVCGRRSIPGMLDIHMEFEPEGGTMWFQRFLCCLHVDAPPAFAPFRRPRA